LEPSRDLKVWVIKLLAQSIILISLSINPICEKSSVWTVEDQILSEPYNTEESWSYKMLSSATDRVITNKDAFFDISEMLNRLE
jgi:hypothetical protein